jgi:hypothetical protein
MPYFLRLPSHNKRRQRLAHIAQQFAVLLSMLVIRDNNKPQHPFPELLTSPAFLILYPIPLIGPGNRFGCFGVIGALFTYFRH